MTHQSGIADDWQGRLAELGLDPGVLLDDSPDQLPLAGKWQRLSKPGLGGRERWRWDVGDGGDPGVLFVKRYQRTPMRAQWDRIFRQNARHSTAWWEYDQSRRLADAHVPAPRPVAFAERMRARFEACSAVVVERVPGDAFERAWAAAERDGARTTRGAARHDVTRRLARFVAAFHGTGFFHRDLYLCHVFVELDPDAARPPRFSLIDLARTHKPRLRRMRWLIKDLAQLDFSARRLGAARTDRFRFLLTYLALAPGAPRARWYARRIRKKSDWIMHRDQRNRRAE
jgi:heptose I phosphotransferase